MRNLLILICVSFFISCGKRNIDNVIIEQEIPGVKLMATVHISDRLEQNELKDYAENIYSTYYGETFENVFIKYILPETIDGIGSYATTHYNPNLQISIYEMTNSEIKKVKKHFNLKKPYWIEGKILIQFKKENDEYFIKQYGNDLSSGKLKVERKIKNEDTLYILQEDVEDTYYIHYSTRELELMDKNGIIGRLSN